MDIKIKEPTKRSSEMALAWTNQVLPLSSGSAVFLVLQAHACFKSFLTYIKNKSEENKFFF